MALSANGSRLVAGTSKGLNSNRQDTGLVKIFELQNGEWVQLGSTLFGLGTRADFGFNVAFSADGTIMASGSHGWGAKGIMQVFQYNNGDWIQLGENIVGEANNDAFGIDVDMTPDGSRIAVGANRNDGNGNNSGHVRMFDFVNGAWVQVGSDIDGEGRDDLSGGQVAMSADGTRVAIGAQAADNKGHVRVFDETSVCCSN